MTDEQQQEKLSVTDNKERSKAKRYSPDEIQAALNDIKAGQTLAAVAEKHNVSINTLSTWKKKAETKSPIQSPKQNSEQKAREMLLDLALKDSSIREQIIDMILDGKLKIAS
ncbi:transposase [Methylobacter sp.]|uniref:transposase n=1 Tax=Methylobacter sp. TaxID=2051955 RepID=UPI003DA1E876